MPAPWRLLPGPSRLYAQERESILLRPPGLQLLSHPTGARHQCHEAHPLLHAEPKRACTLGLAIGHKATHTIQAQRSALLKGYRRLGAVTGVAST